MEKEQIVNPPTLEYTEGSNEMKIPGHEQTEKKVILSLVYKCLLLHCLLNVKVKDQNE